MHDFSGKTVLITGATGFLGSYLGDILLKNGARVIALARNESKIQGCYQDYIQTPQFDYILKDISSGNLEIDEPIDYIFHAAGSIELSTQLNKPMNIVNPSVIGTIKCLDFLKRQKECIGKTGRIIFFSSEAVYGKTEKDRTVSEKDTEVADSLCSQRATYSTSKRMGEVIIDAYHKEYGLDTVIARFSWVYGNAKFKPKQALFDFIESALNKQNIIIRNPQTPRRDNIYIEDAIDGLLTIACKGISGEAYNISSNNELDNFAAADEIANIIIQIANEDLKPEKPMEIIYSDSSTYRQGGVILDNSKLKQLGWDISTSLEDGIRILFKEIKDNVH